MLVQTHAMQVSGVWLRLNQETLGIMAKSGKSRIWILFAVTGFIGKKFVA